MRHDDEERDLIEVLGDEFTQRLRAGEHPSIEQFAARHPDRADEIRELLPAIAALEQVRSRQSSETGVKLPSCPERLDDFQLMHEIGRGGMGVVYEAEQLSLRRRVAIKLLPPDTSASAARRSKRFRREAMLAAQLHHTNIVPVFGVGESDGYHYMVMQRIDGLPLDRLLSRLAESSEDADAPTTQMVLPLSSSEQAGVEPQESTASLSGSASEGRGWPRDTEVTTARMHAAMDIFSGREYWRQVAVTTADAADAIHYAHEQGILHRDIKPANLLLDHDGVVWVADFGLARIQEEDASRTEDMAGTLRYMAPERFEGLCDARSDVYSLGATLYEMVALAPAFQSKDRGKMVKTIAETGPSPPSTVRDVPRDLETIVMKAMAMAPGDRYQTAQEMEADLRRFAEDRPIAARRANALERSWRWCKRNRAIAISATAALLILLVATVFSTAAYYRTKNALTQTVEEQNRTRGAMKLSFDALDELYSRFAPDDMFLASMPTVDSGDLVGVAGTERPVLSEQAGEMLADLLRVYDQFAAQIGAEEEVLRRKLISSRRLGVIQTRLGQYAEAEQTFLAALRRWPDAEDMRIEKARVLNALGGLYDLQQRRGDADQAFENALNATSSLVYDTALPEDDRLAAIYQTAQSCFLLGRSRRLFGNRSRRPYGSQLDRLLDAISLLREATSSTSDPSFRRLLALCYREYNPDPMTDNVDASVRILSELCDEYPTNLSYRYDLSETLGLPPTRRESNNLTLTRIRLLDALDISDQLILSQPNVPLYQESRSHLHRKLADVLLMQGERVEASQHADLAVSIQSDLREQFPESLHYKVWHAVMVEMRARVQDDDGSQALARLELEGIVDELTELLIARPNSPLVAGPLSSAYLTLARIYFQQVEMQEGFVAFSRAMQLREIAGLPANWRSRANEF